MSRIYNVYCDESCHLENDHQQVMVLGAAWCPLEKTKDISITIREIKKEYNLKPDFEIKWIKVSPANINFYYDLVNYFFDERNLHFRALIVPDKTKLKHGAFTQDHETWYYKMYFDMLKVIFIPRVHYRVYLDIKDTRGGSKIAKLHDVLCNNMYDFSRKIIERIQIINSKEVEILQLSDLLIGLISYTNRGLTSSSAKNTLVELMRKRSGYSLIRMTLLRERKVNLFVWHASEAQK